MRAKAICCDTQGEEKMAALRFMPLDGVDASAGGAVFDGIVELERGGGDGGAVGC